MFSSSSTCLYYTRQTSGILCLRDSLEQSSFTAAVCAYCGSLSADQVTQFSMEAGSSDHELRSWAPSKPEPDAYSDAACHLLHLHPWCVQVTSQRTLNESQSLVRQCYCHIEHYDRHILPSGPLARASQVHKLPMQGMRPPHARVPQSG